MTTIEKKPGHVKKVFGPPVGIRTGSKKLYSERGANQGKSRASVTCMVCRGGKSDMASNIDSLGKYSTDMASPLKVCPKGHKLPRKPYYDAQEE